MATKTALGKRRAEAVTRIEQTCQLLGSGAPLALPTFSHYGADMLLIRQLETIAEYLEALPSASPYGGMTNKELTHLIEQRGLEQGTARNKAELIAVLEAAYQAAESAGV